MLIGLRVLQHGGGMNPGLGHERAFADVRRVAVRRAIEHVVERARNFQQRRHLALGHADLEGSSKFPLQPQRRYQRTKVCVAAALAKRSEERRVGKECSREESQYAEEYNGG